ncbi:MAG: DoxX family protein [Betaproteobacteria bacterium]
MSPLSSVLRLLVAARTRLRPLADLLDFGIRLYVARVFFLSGLTKIRDWDTTVLLFEDEYHVPVLPPELAAVFGTVGELAFPILLVVGLGTRFAALGMSLVNVMAVVSYWHVLKDAEPALAQHVYWGVLLLVTLLHGPGRLAIDSWLARRFALPAYRPA